MAEATDPLQELAEQAAAKVAERVEVAAVVIVVLDVNDRIAGGIVTPKATAEKTLTAASAMIGRLRENAQKAFDAQSAGDKHGAS